MAKTQQKNPVNLKTYSWNDRIGFIEDIFFHPQSAFDTFINNKYISGKEILFLHFLLSTTAPVFLFFRNCLSELQSFIFEREPITISNCFNGTLNIWILYIGFFLFIRFLDIFRIYFKFWDRTKNLNPPPNWIFLISFLPFSGSGVFMILPPPWNMFLIGIGFFYCLHTAYLALKTISKTTRDEFFVILLEFGIFIFSITAVLLLFYNIYRTVKG